MTLDTIRALCHDLRQPLAAILLLAGVESIDAKRRFDMILDQAQWLSEVVEGVLGGAADDWPDSIDVVELAARCVTRARPTSDAEIELSGDESAVTVAAPVALSRAISCVLDNAVRAAGREGQVSVKVTGGDFAITIEVVDDGPGLGHVASNNSLGLTITRALVSVCGGGFELEPGATGGVVARIVLPASTSAIA